MPRPGDSQGSLDTEKAWLRSWIDETYLWYQDVRGLPPATLDPANSATPLDYFDKLKSPATTASGKDKDEFHFTYPTPEWIALSQSGVSYGYGFAGRAASTTPRRTGWRWWPTSSRAARPRRPASPAAPRSSTSTASTSPTARPRPLNAGLFPKAAGDHTFVIRDLGASTDRTVTLTAQALASTPVLKVATLPAPNQSVGYILFNDHIATSEAQLVAAINTLKAAAVTDLVLDVRYNGGGYLDIAAELAYMIAGPANTGGKFFERLNYNNRDPFNQSLSERTTAFLNVSQGFSGGRAARPCPTSASAACSCSPAPTPARRARRSSTACAAPA